MSTEIPTFDAISPTALLIAWLRAQSDLPFARAVAEATGAEAGARNLLAESGSPLEEHRYNAPFAEARYRSIVSGLARLGLRQVLDLGAGYTFRGLAMASSPDVLYLDTDLAVVQDVKAALIGSVPELRDRRPAGRVVYAAVDATRAEDVDAVAGELRAGEPVGIVNEGLLGYLGFEEKARVAASVRRLLERHGGAWITPDLATRLDHQRHHEVFAYTRGAHAAIAKKTGRDFMDNAFLDDEHIARFFAELGFDVADRPQVDGSFALDSLARVGLPEERLRAARPRVWVLTLR